MKEHPASSGCPVCSPLASLAVAGRRCTDTRRLVEGGAEYWRFLWREHRNGIRGAAD